MASNLFENMATVAENPEAPKKERRVKLFSYDAVAAQLLQPFGESTVDTLSLQQLWRPQATATSRLRIIVTSAQTKTRTPGTSGRACRRQPRRSRRLSKISSPKT